MNLRHHSEDLVFLDNVGFIKGLDKHNMPRLGDVIVPPPQIIKGFLGYVAADVPLYRFQAKRSAAAAAPSSNAELVCFQQSGIRRARLRARQLGVVAFLRQGTLLLGLLA